MFLLNDYNYDLPDDLIAQKPADQRDHSKLLFLDKKTGKLSHHKFYEIYDLLLPTDLLVLNDTRVIPARLFGKKNTGGKAEVFILDYPGDRKNAVGDELVLRCLIKTSKRPKNGTPLIFDRGLQARVVDCQQGIYTVEFSCKDNFESLLDSIGHVPLPPYIKRNDNKDDRTSYQTVYASQKGAVAAPTAGLHFSKKLLKKIAEKGIGIVTITLHVGYGTFLPVRVSDIRDHKIHSEWYSISKDTADAINRAKTKGRRIIAVGTTCMRALEYASDDQGNLAHGGGTLLMLVSAFAGRENILNAYRTAIDKKYRLFSYGDAMLIA
ncbi:MAG: tRNA preQ1(34) S-adenosylmethionine ribosyltransferase-isomerase QueA [Deltaproteobacteria bacterium]|nr:tRNA preQ1(34) S-adenosylmethionine ribosyltransferase-isomerase QueA [Deltaproteobacteria bacterium]